MSAQQDLQNARDFILEQNGSVAPLPMTEEELNPTLQDDLTLRAYAVEDMGRCYDVPYSFPDDSDASEFGFFEDGRQRTVQIGYIPAEYGLASLLIPVHFFVVAAVILRREGRRLSLWSQPVLDSGILVARSLVPDQHVLAAFESAGLRVVDTSPPSGGDYYRLRQRALQCAKVGRLAAEDGLIARWRATPEAGAGFLVVDGTLMNLRNEDSVERCVGVSKSFGSRYFPVSAHNRIMQMAEYQRSWTFRFHSPEEEEDDTRLGARERISWYLRLRTRPNTDPEFGLVRVEISPRHADQASKLADRFSRSLLSERLPTSYPIARWDNHLYPIHACESYLASVMPSIATINASMRG